MPRREGNFLVEDFFVNDGGLNTADSPFVVDKSECTDGQNFDYVRRGGVQKRLGHAKRNSSADSQLRTKGLTLWDKPNAPRVLVRAAGTKLQNWDLNTNTATNLTEDTVSAGTTFLDNSSTTPVAGVMFNTPLAGVLWNVGSGATSVYGVYSSSKVTANGAAAPTGSISTSVSASGTGTFSTAGTYYYSVGLTKASTGATSNAALDKSATLANATDTVTITLSSLGAVDTTKYTKLVLYRSSVGGASGFTAGSIVKEIDISGGVPASTTDTGSVFLSSQSVPRADSLVTDNSLLPSGTYKSLALFKRRLVAAKDSTLYLSDVNKSESWPTANAFAIPSGGEITALATIGISSPISSEIDEILCIFKQNELWVLTGDDVENWSLKLVGRYGAPNQSVIVSAEGYIFWLNYKGPFFWNGSGKPKFLGQKIKDKFMSGGDIDKSKLGIAFGLFSQRRNEIQWYLSSKTLGDQKYALKLNLDLAQTQGSSNLMGTEELEGRFTPDALSFPAYAGTSFFESADAVEESIILGDDAGHVYTGFISTAEAGAEFTFEYVTPYLSFGRPSEPKRISKIIAWVLDAGPVELTLDYWADYRFRNSDASTLKQQVSASLVRAGAVWGQFNWGEKNWGSNADKIKPIIFNPAGTKNNTEGDSIRLRFSQTGDSETVVIYGFSIYYTELPTRK